MDELLWADMEGQEPPLHMGSSLTLPMAHMPVGASTIITDVHTLEADVTHRELTRQGIRQVGIGVEANTRTGHAHVPAFAYLTIEYEGGTVTTTMHPGRAPCRFLRFADGGNWPTGMMDIGKLLCAKCDTLWHIGQNYCTCCGIKLPLPLLLCGTRRCNRLTFADSCDRCATALFPCHTIRMYE